MSGATCKTCGQPAESHDESKCRLFKTEPAPKRDRETVQETINDFLIRCFRNYGHYPSEMTLPKPLADRLLSEVFVVKTTPEQTIYPDGDFKMSAPTGMLKIRVNR